MKKILSLLSLFLILFPLFSQETLQEEDAVHIIQIDPQEELNTLMRNGNTISLELNDNKKFSLQLVETKILSDELAREISHVKTFNAFMHGKFVGTYTWSSIGVWYYLNIENQKIAVYPEVNERSNKHYVEYGIKKVEGSFCGNHDGHDHRNHGVDQFTPEQMRDIQSTFGDDLRDYRLYLVTTGEFYRLNGNNFIAVDAVLTATINGLNAVYQNELSLKFTLVDRRLYTDPATDPFIPDNQGGAGRTVQAGTVINSIFGASRYDIGHVVHRSESGDGWSSGGLAQLNSVCNDFVFAGGQIAKASAWSGSFNTNGFSWISLFAHELGHQFGAQHTFNGSGSNCDDAISETTAYEIGSGTTIMSYNGICSADQNISSSGASDNYFHVNSLMQMMNHIVGNGDCAVKEASGNNIPEVTINPCGANIVIPRSTPFYLDADATDADGDDLTYCWEQFDEDGPGVPTQGNIGINAAVNPIGPLFRSFPPSEESFRYFPAKNTVLNGNTSDPFDVLPALARTVNMKLTVRDNNPNGGATNIVDLPLTISSAGPLSVQNQTNWTTGDNVTISWSTGGSDNLCANADIYLSIDGGETYPYLIGDDVDYSAGTFSFDVSGLYPSATNARIKIECDDFECFYFYDITNGTFSIISECGAPTSFLCPADDKMFDAGDPGLNMTDQTNIIGQKLTGVRKRVTFGSPNMDVVTYDTNGTTCRKVSDDYVAEFQTFQVDKSGTYIFSIDPNSDGFGFVSVFTDDNFSPTNACPSFVSSSGVWSGSGSSVSARSSLVATLEACTTYRLVLYNYAPPAFTEITNITGPGNVIEEETMADPDYSFVYIAVNNETNIIQLVNQNPDFTSLTGGSYTVYGITYKSGGPTPPNITDFNNYLNQTFNSFYIDGDCFLSSTNSFNLEIEGSCALTGASLGNTGNCNPVDNSFTQDVILTYDVTPGSGELSVNGELFAITSSPQTVTITLPSDGQLFTGEAFFTIEPNCRVTFEVQQPENCCPFEINLGDTVAICEGNDFMLDAGTGGIGGTYQWFDGQGNDLMVDEQTLTGNMAGVYSVLVTSDTGCPKSDSVEVTVNAVPSITVSDDVTICDGEFTTLTANTNGTTIRWLSADTLIQEGPMNTLTVNTGGTYVVESYFVEECKAVAQIIVTANESPDPDLGEDVFLCEGENVVLDGTADGTTYQWFINDVLQAETGTSLTVDATSTVRVEVTNDGGCKGIDEVDVLVEGIPTLEVSDDITICDGTPTTLTATTAASLIKWYVDGVLLESGSETTFEVITGGTVLVEAGNSEACSVTDSIIVTAEESPDPNLGFNVQECEGETVRLSANAEGVTYRWFWNNALLPESDSFIVVNLTGTYRVEVTNEGDCTSTDEVEVEFFALANADAGMDINFCEGEMASVNGTSSSIVYFWFKDGQPYPEDDLSFMTDEPGVYVLEAQNEAECSVFDTIVITEVPAPPVDFGDDIVACIGDVVDLEGPVQTGYEYQWFKDGIPLADTESIAVDSDGIYLLVVTDENGCSGEDAIEIGFEPGPTLSINETSISICEGDSFTAEVMTNASMVQWFKDGDIINGATGNTFIITESGNYTAQAEGTSGCLVTEDVEVIVNSLPDVSLGMDIVECEGTLINLESNVMGEVYSWQFGGSEISDESSVEVDQQGTYTLIVTNEFDCQASDDIEISYVPLPSIDLVSNAEYCEGESVMLNATSDGASFQWLLNGNPIAGATSPNYNANEPGTYEFIATGQGSCTNSQEVVVTEVTAPVVDLGGDVTLCPGESITLDAGPNSGATFEWSTGENTRTIDLSNDDVNLKTIQSVFVDVTNNAGCVTNQTILVTYIPVLDVMISSDGDGVCTGDSLFITATGAEDYTWNGPAGTFDLFGNSSILVYPGSLSEYTVMGSDECPNNMDTDTIIVDVFTPGIVSAGNDTCVLIGRSIDLNASGGAAYSWESDPTITSGLNSSSPTVMPEVETTYTVTITDINGCKQSDQVTVCIISDPLSIFKAVNAITPNGDGFNDELEFPGLEAFETNRLVIYNRWGNVVFEKDGYQTDDFLFKGLRNGEELPADTYYYVLTFDEFIVKETLTIIRPN